MTRPLTLTRLARRQLTTDLGAVLALATTTVLATALLTAWPRVVDHVVAQDRVEAVAALNAVTRDLTPPIPPPVWLPGVPSHDELAAALTTVAAEGEELVDGLGPELRSVVGPPEHVVVAPGFSIELGVRDTPFSTMSLSAVVDPRADERVRVVEGRAPQAPAAPPEVEFMLSTAAAEELGWRVGETRASLQASVPVVARLSGTFEPVDPASSAWSHTSPLLTPVHAGSENAGWSAQAAGLVHPDALARLTSPVVLYVQRWVPVRAEAVAGADPARLVADLERARADLALRSETHAAVEAAQQRATAVTAVLGVVATGALGTAGVALWLGSVLVAQRRGAALVLLRSRGMSARALPMLVAAQTLVATVPGGVLGTVVGLRLAPGPVRLADLVAPALATVLTAGLAAFAAWRRSRQVAPVRRAHHPWRWVAELLVVLAAGTAAGLVASSRDAGDPVLAALPVLLGVAAAAVGLRLHPLLLAPADRPARRGRRLGPFLAVAQLARAGTGAAVPVVGLVVAGGTVALMATVLSVVDASTEESAARGAGGDVRLEILQTAAGRTPLTSDDVAAVADVPGVRAVAAVRDGGRATLSTGDGTDAVSVLVVDAAALSAVQRSLPSAVRSPLTTLAADGDSLPGVLLPRSAGVATGAEVAIGRGPDEAPVAAVAVVGEAPGVASGTAWVVVDDTTWAPPSGAPDAVGSVLVGLQPGSDPDVVATAVDRVLDGRVSVSALADRVQDARAGALTAGLRSALGAVGVVTVTIAALVLGLALLGGAPPRERAASVLAGLGAPRALRRRLVVGESLGLLAAALPAAVAVAAALPLLVLRVVDLRVFTGTPTSTTATTDPVLVVGLGGLGVVLGGAAVLVATVSARRAAASGPLREGGAP
ncbi:hypothetical protein H9657_04535 [Cellulomonas sp. Sa3CUA2]|uniref:ABC3 transporter permease protein domain-containing protein n=1 Tax=Cellulomonas avistercoris TaxID=2762242 RepID=A0ABR8QAS6_9CELL|nr:hypothetical protein [Cellulomonas avistercoris]MBD7917546.1 hypothetical protein [Cellulomonas avistercoris]